MTKVLIIANSSKTKGGITTVLKIWERMPFWKEYHCKWVETQINASIWRKLYYISSYLICAFILPFYNIVHFHSAPGMSSLVQMPIFIWAMVWRKKIIMHLHVGNQLLDHINDRVFKFILKRSNKTVVLADIWKKELYNHFKDAHDVEVIYNPAPDIDINNSLLRENMVLFAAYLVPNKGYDVVIRAFNQARIIHPDWQLLIAGAGEIEKASALIKELSADNYMRVIGWQSPEQIAQLYQRASIYCIASEKEGFPMSSLECWANGIPLITTPVGGLIDVVKDHENCLLFDFGNVDQLVSCMSELMEDKQLRDRLSFNSQQMVKRYFSVNTVNQQIRSLYKSL